MLVAHQCFPNKIFASKALIFDWGCFMVSLLPSLPFCDLLSCILYLLCLLHCHQCRSFHCFLESLDFSLLLWQQRSTPVFICPYPFSLTSDIWVLFIYFITGLLLLVMRNQMKQKCKGFFKVITLLIIIDTDTINYGT